jgi:hypothetical protein
MKLSISIVVCFLCCLGSGHLPESLENELPVVVLVGGDYVGDFVSGEVVTLGLPEPGNLISAVWNGTGETLYGLWRMEGTGEQRIYGLESGSRDWKLIVPLENIPADWFWYRSLAVDPTGRTGAVFVTTPGGEQPDSGIAVFLYDLENGEPLGSPVEISFLGEIHGNMMNVQEATWSPDGNLIAVQLQSPPLAEVIALVDSSCVLETRGPCEAIEFLPDSLDTPYVSPTWADVEILLSICDREPVCLWNFSDDTLNNAFRDLYPNINSAPTHLSVLDNYLAASVPIDSDLRSVDLIDLDSSRIVAALQIPQGAGGPVLVPAYALAGILEAQGAGDD